MLAPGGMVASLLADTSGPQPVLLIDGWDELGAQGERMRERLVEFCRAFPRAVVMVSSRPYGETRPAGAEAFETLHIQPLSDEDVRLLATRFHRRAHGLDESSGARATDEFMAALAATPDARALARTALLLTMMLLLSREGPLPDRRHKLYTACLRNMLLHRVTSASATVRWSMTISGVRTTARNAFVWSRSWRTGCKPRATRSRIARR